MSVDEQGDMSPRMATSRRDTKQFADFVRIHALDGNLITRDDEMRKTMRNGTRTIRETVSPMGRFTPAPRSAATLS